MEERRTEHRYEVWLPVKTDALREGLAVTHNVSEGGALVVTASTLEPGSPVSLTLRMPGGKGQKTLRGTVQRVETNEEDPHGLWPHRMAIAFDERQPDLESMLARVERDM